MTDKLYTPTEVSRRLGMQTSKLRRYVSYFPDLFSQPAKRQKKRRYTTNDVGVFVRIREIGNHISVTNAVYDPGVIDKLGLSNEEAAMREYQEYLMSLSDTMRQFREEIRSLYSLFKLTLSVFSDRQKEVGQRLDSLSQRMNATEGLSPGTPYAKGEYVRSRMGRKWHWCHNCSNYPKSHKVIRMNERPSPGELCKECSSKERRGECKNL